MTEREAIEKALQLLPQMRDSQWVTAVGKVTAIYTDEAKEAFNIAISALEKQSVDKCCETCKHKDRLASEWRCSECFRASNLEDYWEPYTEEES